jgi:hypothetical protein
MIKDTRQLELPLKNPPKLRLIKGEGQRVEEKLDNREAVMRVLIEAGADMLLRRISPERAEFIEQQVEDVLSLFDRVDREPAAMAELKKKLDDLEGLMRQTRDTRVRRRI